MTQKIPWSGPSVSVVIPCYNEEESIEQVIRAVPAGVLEIIVVDNNSTDRTAKIAARNGARVVMEKKRGYGPALQCGFDAAAGDIIATLDGDNQYPPYKILDAVDFLVSQNLDFVSASRFPLDDKDSMPRIRKIGNWGLTLATNTLFFLSLRDAQSGMWIFRKEVLNYFTLESASLSPGMSFSNEIKVRAATNPRIRFGEYHVPYHPRLGESKLHPFRDGWKMLMFLFKLRLEPKSRQARFRKTAASTSPSNARI